MTGNIIERFKQYAQIASIKNVNVRKKNSAISPTFLRRDAMLEHSMSELWGSCHRIQKYAQEQERNDEPDGEVDSQCGVEFGGLPFVGIENARSRDVQGSERHPECTIHSESCNVKAESTFTCQGREQLV